MSRFIFFAFPVVRLLFPVAQEIPIQALSAKCCGCAFGSFWATLRPLPAELFLRSFSHRSPIVLPFIKDK